MDEIYREMTFDKKDGLKLDNWYLTIGRRRRLIIFINMAYFLLRLLNCCLSSEEELKRSISHSSVCQIFQ